MSIVFDADGAVVVDPRGLPPRFWRRVRRTPTCWLWIGAFANGYGAFWRNGRNHGAHRVALSAALGRELLDEMHACHRCDVKACVRFDHLFEGPHAANVADMVNKGRQYRPTGDRHHNRLLSAAQVAEIRARLARGERGSDIAKAFGVHRNTIYSVKSGQSWR